MSNVNLNRGEKKETEVEEKEDTEWEEKEDTGWKEGDKAQKVKSLNSRLPKQQRRLLM